ncbi:hypothetical protein HK098_000932 [Nowakowskiella sp. JEL0407]|nr:hypothetical protein HK098_000932 [Nowakowskiella sp. JEL0407]
MAGSEIRTRNLFDKELPPHIGNDFICKPGDGDVKEAGNSDCTDSVEYHGQVSDRESFSPLLDKYLSGRESWGLLSPSLTSENTDIAGIESEEPRNLLVNRRKQDERKKDVKVVVIVNCDQSTTRSFYKCMKDILGDEVVIIVLDDQLPDEISIRRTFQRVKLKFKKIDVLIVNTAFKIPNHSAMNLEFDSLSYAATLVLAMIKDASPLLVVDDSDELQKRIMIICSDSKTIAGAFNAAQVIHEQMVLSLCESLRTELKSFGIKLHIIVPHNPDLVKRLELHHTPIHTQELQLMKSLSNQSSLDMIHHPNCPNSKLSYSLPVSLPNTQVTPDTPQPTLNEEFVPTYCESPESMSLGSRQLSLSSPPPPPSIFSEVKVADKFMRVLAIASSGSECDCVECTEEQQQQRGRILEDRDTFMVERERNNEVDNLLDRAIREFDWNRDTDSTETMLNWPQILSFMIFYENWIPAKMYLHPDRSYRVKLEYLREQNRLSQLREKKPIRVDKPTSKFTIPGSFPSPAAKKQLSTEIKASSTDVIRETLHLILSLLLYFVETIILYLDFRLLAEYFQIIHSKYRNSLPPWVKEEILAKKYDFPANQRTIQDLQIAEFSGIQAPHSELSDHLPSTSGSTSETKKKWWKLIKSASSQKSSLLEMQSSQSTCKISENPSSSSTDKGAILRAESECTVAMTEPEKPVPPHSALSSDRKSHLLELMEASASLSSNTTLVPGLSNSISSTSLETHSRHKPLPNGPQKSWKELFKRVRANDKQPKIAGIVDELKKKSVKGANVDSKAGEMNEVKKHGAEGDAVNTGPGKLQTISWILGWMGDFTNTFADSNVFVTDATTNNNSAPDVEKAKPAKDNEIPSWMFDDSI